MNDLRSTVIKMHKVKINDRFKWNRSQIIIAAEAVKILLRKPKNVGKRVEKEVSS